MVIFHAWASLQPSHRSYLRHINISALCNWSPHHSRVHLQSMAAICCCSLVAAPKLPRLSNVEWKERMEQLFWSSAAASALLTTWQIHSSAREASRRTKPHCCSLYPYSSPKLLVSFLPSLAFSFPLLPSDFKMLSGNAIGRQGAGFFPNGVLLPISLLIFL